MGSRDFSFESNNKSHNVLWIVSVLEDAFDKNLCRRNIAIAITEREVMFQITRSSICVWINVVLVGP